MKKQARPTPKITEHNAETGAITVRDLTPEEMTIWEAEHATADNEAEIEAQRLESYQVAWDNLHSDTADLQSVVEFLRCLVPNRPE